MMDDSDSSNDKDSDVTRRSVDVVMEYENGEFMKLMVNQ